MIQAYFNGIKSEITNLLNEATKELRVAVCWFTQQDLFNILLTKLSKDVSIELIVLNDAINNRPDGLNFQKFIDAGGKLYFADIENPMHNKFCVIDGEILINGSYNWTYYAEQRNKENIMVAHNKELIKQYLLEFEKLTKELELVTNVAEVANTDSQQDTIVENIKLASNTDIIIEAQKELDSKNLNLVASIGEVLKGDKFCVLLKKGESIPCKKKNTFQTSSDNQTSSHVTVKYGESEKGIENSVIGNYRHNNLPPMKEGEVKFITTHELDVYGILTVTSEIQQTGQMLVSRFNVGHLITESN